MGIKGKEGLGPQFIALSIEVRIQEPESRRAESNSHRGTENTEFFSSKNE
jgi:hypothetical protein